MRLFKHLLLASTAGLLIAGAAQAADLPTKKTPPAPPATNCYASFYSWLDSTAADCPLTYMGITVYGQIDVGGGYETHASGFNKDFNNGVSELIAKSSKGGRWQAVPNGLSQSNIGIKMKEQVAPNWFIVGDVNLGFDPYSFRLANGPGSLVDNNGSPTPQWTANSDSSRAGQWDNARGYVGVSNTTFGTLTVGRQYAFSNDMAANYDPSGGSYGFSLIGSSGTPVQGLGDTELARYNTSVKYQVAYSGFRAGALWDFGNYSDGDSSNGAYQFDVGFDYMGFSVDAIYAYARDAEFLSSGAAGTDDLTATIANVQSEAIAAKYKIGPFQAFAGYSHDELSDPSDSYAKDLSANGFTGLGGYWVVPGASLTTYKTHKILQTGWVGAKYSILSNLDISAAYYYEWQNDYTAPGAAQTCTGPGTSQTKTCAGHEPAYSALLDWRPVKRVDVYAGVMYSELDGGMASGYKLPNGTAWKSDVNNTAFTSGVRVSF
ncbi:MAG: porin [Roseiarcus sp.]|jgi:predicted porin